MKLKSLLKTSNNYLPSKITIHLIMHSALPVVRIYQHISHLAVHEEVHIRRNIYLYHIEVHY